jgi:hypothetical protein
VIEIHLRQAGADVLAPRAHVLEGDALLALAADLIADLGDARRKGMAVSS